jgi:hypothetical protein
MLATRIAVRPDQLRSTRSEVQYQIAGTFEQRMAAFRLVYENYLQKGLIEPNRWKLRTTPYHLLPTTNVFIATRNHEVVCTVTLIGDGSMGLPMESIYGDVVQERRRNGLYVGEVSCLAVHGLELRGFLPMFVQLTRLMAQHARMHGMDQFLITSHPQHSKFYQRFMGMERVGPLREYPHVRNAPAVASCLDFHAIDVNRPKCYETYFGSPLPADELRPQPMSEFEKDFFALAAADAPYELTAPA